MPKAQCSTFRLGFGFEPLALCLFSKFLLVLHQHRHQVARCRVEHPHELLHRGLQHEEQLRVQLRPAGQAGEIRHRLRLDRLALQHRCLDLQHRRRFHEHGQRLRQRDRVIARVGNRRRPLEVRFERRQPGALARPLRERVLHDLVVRLRAAQLPTELGDLRHVQPLVIDKDGGVGRLEGRLEGLQFLFFFRSGDSHRSPYCAFARSSMCAVSIATPGPIVEETVTDFRYLPFAADGFALTTESTSAWAFSIRFCAGKEVLPSGAWMMPVLSTRNSTLPALISLIACATFGVTVPVFGFGISPRGPSTFPSLPTARIMSGVATTASKSIQPPRIFSTTSSPPTKSAPASCASFCLSEPAMASTFLLLPRPCGRTTVPRTIWSACLGSTPRRIVTSTVSSNLAYFTFWISGIASSIVYGRDWTCAAAAVNFLPCFAMFLLVVLTGLNVGLPSHCCFLAVPS